MSFLFRKASFVIIEDVLTKEEMAALMEFVLQHETEFESSFIIQAGTNQRIINHNDRRARVLYNIGIYNNLIQDRIHALLPSVLKNLDYPQFPISVIETRITASNDGDFFKIHNDNTPELNSTRELSFVYYFYQEPRPFSGGELRVYDTRFDGQKYQTAGNSIAIIPRQNSIVFFPSLLIHELTKVHCSSRAFIDSRFTLNGWLRR